MIVFEIEVDTTNSDEEKIDNAIYSAVEAISVLEEDGKVFKIIIEEVDTESVELQSRTLH